MRILFFGEPVSRQQRANAVRLPSPTAEIGKGGIKFGPVILLILIVCAACLVYLWFSSVRAAATEKEARLQKRPLSSRKFDDHDIQPTPRGNCHC